eukprot:Em0006g361a
MPSRNQKKRSKQRAEYLQKQDDILSQENKAKARARYKADPEKKKASVRDSYKADPEKKKASERDNYKADPEKKKASVRDSYTADPEKKKASVRDSYKADSEKKKASVRDSYNADIESKQSAKRQRYQEDVEENRAAKRQKYEDNSAAIKASERNRYWNDPAVRLAKRAAEMKRYRRGHRTTTTTQSYSLYEPKSHALMEYNGGLEKAILRDSELLSEVNDAFYAVLPPYRLPPAVGALPPPPAAAELPSPPPAAELPSPPPATELPSPPPAAELPSPPPAAELSSPPPAAELSSPPPAAAAAAAALPTPPAAAAEAAGAPLQYWHQCPHHHFACCHPGHCHHHPHGSHGLNQAAEDLTTNGNPSKFITVTVIGTVLSLLSHHAATPVVTFASKRIVGLSGDVTKRSKAAGLLKTQFGAKRNSMMAKRIKSNLRAQGAARTIGNLKAKPPLHGNLKLGRVEMETETL